MRLTIILIKVVAAVSVSWLMWQAFQPLNQLYDRQNNYTAIVAIALVAWIILLLTRTNVAKVVTIAVCTFLGFWVFDIVFFAGLHGLGPISAVIGGSIGGWIGIKFAASRKKKVPKPMLDSELRDIPHFGN